jgi:hypothetical protein
MTRRFSLLCAAAAALVLAGCAGYRLGPSGGQKAGARSVEIEPFLNKTIEPRLGDYLMSSLRRNLQKDGTYRVETQHEGDVILTGVINTYQRVEISVQPVDAITPLDYEISMIAQITARERSTGKVLFDRPVRGRTSIRAGEDLTSSERQAFPLMADDLAKKAMALLVDGAW